MHNVLGCLNQPNPWLDSIDQLLPTPEPTPRPVAVPLAPEVPVTVDDSADDWHGRDGWIVAPAPDERSGETPGRWDVGFEPGQNEQGRRTYGDKRAYREDQLRRRDA